MTTPLSREPFYPPDRLGLLQKRPSSLIMDADLHSSPDEGAAKGLLSDSDPDAPVFYIHKEGVNYGPESAENLRGLCSQGWLQRTDMVWREGQPDWQPAEGIFPAAFLEEDVAKESPAPAATDTNLEDDDFFEPGAFRFSTESPRLWSSIGIALVVHGLILLVAIELLRLYPIKLRVDTTPVSQDPPPHVQVGLLGRVLLVVEVVEQADDSPAFDLCRIRDARPPGAGPHGLLDGAAVLAQGVRLRELVQKVPGLLARRPASVAHGSILAAEPDMDRRGLARGMHSRMCN